MSPPPAVEVEGLDGARVAAEDVLGAPAGGQVAVAAGVLGDPDGPRAGDGGGAQEAGAQAERQAGTGVLGAQVHWVGETES